MGVTERFRPIASSRYWLSSLCAPRMRALGNTAIQFAGQSNLMVHLARCLLINADRVHPQEGRIRFGRGRLLLPYIFAIPRNDC